MASISLCSRILSTISSPAFQMLYEKGIFTSEATNELNKLKVSIERIQPVLDDAEKKQEDSEAVKDWIQRFKGVLYDAEDLFDEVITEDLLKQQIQQQHLPIYPATAGYGGSVCTYPCSERVCSCIPRQMIGVKNKLSMKNKVRASKLNPVVFRNTIAKKVQAIRKGLAELSADMGYFGFVQGQPMVNMRSGMYRTSYRTWNFFDAESIVGRGVDKDSILEMLFDDYPDITDAPVVIVVDGIGGMGKSTLAHLIYDDKAVKNSFPWIWFASFSNSFDEKEVLTKIYHSISGEHCNNFTLMQLEEKIRESIEGKTYLLILDDVWDDHRGRWEKRIDLLSSGANGSRILVTTRLNSVVCAVGATRAHYLKGLSEDDSWDLFKNLAFPPGHENDPRLEIVGRDLLKRCGGLPLSIRSLGACLRCKTIQEWYFIQSVGLQRLRDHNEVMHVLKLSYDHLLPNLKQCFTYCSLFLKGCRYTKKELIYHWTSQGFIHLDEGESSFMSLLSMHLFQEVEEDELGAIESCKMQDNMHDLALYMAGEESFMQNGTTMNVRSCTRYVTLEVDCEEGGLRDIPKSLLNSKSIRSCTLRGLSSRHSQPHLGQLCFHFKLLRTLTLSDLRIEHIPPSIGELKLVRYLDLSKNNFEGLPDSIADLVNLRFLNLEGCRNLNEWPLSFKNLFKLESLNLKNTDELLSMPEGIAGMVSLQNLSDFRVQKWSHLDELPELFRRLRGYLLIKFDQWMEVGDEGRWQLPADTSLQYLQISSYPGHRICWGSNESGMKLENLKLDSCKNVEHLPPMSCLLSLKWLQLGNLPELEFIEESEEVNPATSQKFFPCLDKLVLLWMRKLKGWRREVAAEATSTISGASAFMEFSHLSELRIINCPNLDLKSFPQCTHLRKLQLENVAKPSAIFCSSNCSSLEEISISNCKWLSGIPGEALTSLRQLVIEGGSSLKSLHLASPRLLHLTITNCDELVRIELDQRPSLLSLEIRNCRQLKILHMKTDNWPDLALQQGLPKVKVHKLVLERVDSMVTALSSVSVSSLREISISNCKGSINLTYMELTSLKRCDFKNIDGLQSLHIPSSHLQSVTLEKCVGLTSVNVKAPTRIDVRCCSELIDFCIAEPSALRSLQITSPSSVDWCSISNLYECTGLTEIYLNGVHGAFIEQLYSSSPLTALEIFSAKNACGLEILHIKSPRLRRVYIDYCLELTRVELQPGWCFYVYIRRCSQLSNVRIPHPIATQLLEINECPELRLSSGVDWGSLTNLNYLRLRPLPPLGDLQLPQSLLQRHAQRKLKIQEAFEPRASDSASCT